MDEEADMVDEEVVIQGTPVIQFSVFLENQVGALLSVVRLLNDRQIEVLGLSVHDSIDATIVRIVVSDPDAVDTLFMERGIPFGKMALVVVELREGASELGRCLSPLLQAEINVNFAYPLLTRPHGKALLALCVEDTEFASEVLLKSAYTLLNQEDLTR